ncbi:MAG: hypothetical protein CMM84_14040 [Rhodothermaceae bacterium]|nr:hypothetical protein [Rhodothermaceae bacterium]MBC13308.1 hypothetical protein [Rhodothermaceae bacterium]
MRFLVAAFAACTVLSACQDPAGVGLGLIDEEQLDPSVRTVALSGLGTTPDTTIAIGIADGTNTDLLQTRVLVGSVVDPTYGDARARAYVDVIQAANLPSDATAEDVTAAWLVLTQNYVYGDTTTTLPLELRPITETWFADTDYARNRTLSTGDVLATTEVSVADSLRQFDLPASWVAANAATLVGDGFLDAFEGFAIDIPADYVPAPGAVYGFSTFASTGSGLRVVVGEDTLVYPLSEVFSSVTSGTASTPPSTALPVRNNSGLAVGFEVDFSTIGASALARARLRLPLDESFAAEGPFVRPIPARSVLYGINDDGRVALAEVLYVDGELSVTNTSILTPLVQRILLDPSTGFDRYEVLPSSGTTSLDILPIRLPSVGTTDLPRFTLTVVGGTSS